MEAWEYSTINATADAHAKLNVVLNNAGAKGWELVALTDNDPVLGVNSLVAVVKRRIVPFDPPRDETVAWHRDPSERYTQRFWDGESWTFNVKDETGTELRDPPTRLTPAQREQ